MPAPAKKILIYGVTGSGKTTLAGNLSERIGIPWHSVDDLTFEADWQPVPDEIQADRIVRICQGDEWILDTAYGRWLEIPLAQAELIVGLDYSHWFVFQRLLRRTFMRVVDGRPVCNGNRETLKTSFSRNSIILWQFQSFAKKRGRLRKWEKEPNGPKVIRFTNPRQTETWLKSLSRVPATESAGR